MTLPKRAYPTIENFSCPQGQFEILKILQEEHPDVFQELVSAATAAHKKFNRDVIVTVYHYNTEDHTTKELNDVDKFKSLSSFMINTNVCSTYHHSLKWYTENIFLICY